MKLLIILLLVIGCGVDTTEKNEQSFESENQPLVEALPTVEKWHWNINTELLDEYYPIYKETKVPAFQFIDETAVKLAFNKIGKTREIFMYGDDIHKVDDSYVVISLITGEIIETNNVEFDELEHGIYKSHQPYDYTMEYLMQNNYRCDDNGIYDPEGWTCILNESLDLDNLIDDLRFVRKKYI